MFPPPLHFHQKQQMCASLEALDVGFHFHKKKSEKIHSVHHPWTTSRSDSYSQSCNICRKMCKDESIKECIVWKSGKKGIFGKFHFFLWNWKNEGIRAFLHAFNMHILYNIPVKNACKKALFSDFIKIKRIGIVTWTIYSKSCFILFPEILKIKNKYTGS